MGWRIFDWREPIGDDEMILGVAIEVIVLGVVVVLMALKPLTSWVPIERVSLLSKGVVMMKNDLLWQEPRWILTVWF